MKTFHIFALLICAIPAWDAHALMDHSRHRGMGGADKGSGSCIRPGISKMQPAHLATAAPGSTFSFVLSNVDDPKRVSVEIKQQPVEIKSEFKDPNYIISGQLPANLQNTAARVDVKVDSNIALCRAAEGWLVKISGN